ncbi:MAG: site-specific integrase, partial [Mariprofundaceae bacterium]|nr:site-specific integrase [Mariprofundaceae bacterium]
MLIEEGFERVEGLLQRLAMLRNWSRQTLAAYRSDLMDVHTFLQTSKTTLFDAQSEVLVLYLGTLMKRGLRASSIQRKRSALSTWYSFLQQEGFRDDQPVRNLPKQRRGRSLPKNMSEDDVNHLLKAPDIDSI